jgi:hypothetical protein
VIPYLPSALLYDGDPLDRAAAADAARRELAKQGYQDAKPPLAYRAINYLLSKIDEALSRASKVVPGGGFGVFVLIVLLGGLIALVLWRVRPSGDKAVGGELFSLGDTLTADGHRARAEQLAAQGKFAEAVRERLRAVARELEARGVVDPRPGRTADELAREAGTAVPGIGAALQRGTHVFDDVWYGEKSADASSYATLVEVDTSVREARLVRA